jgi:hypothetical protein
MPRGLLRLVAGLVPALLLSWSVSAAPKKAPAPKQARSARTAKKTAKVSKAQAAKRRRHMSRLLEVLPSVELGQTPAHRYANFTNDEAVAELERRSIAFVEESSGPSGVRAPVRLTGPLHGVEVHSTVPAAERAGSQYELLDARLALALDDFCAQLERKDVVELVHYTMYRPGASPSAETDQLPTRHPGGLAIDVGALRRRDGRWLDVGKHWKAEVGARTCGPGAKAHASESTQELVSIVCEAATRHLFHYMLTPHYDRAHHDHLHLEIKPGAKWFLVS